MSTTTATVWSQRHWALTCKAWPCSTPSSSRRGRLRTAPITPAQISRRSLVRKPVFVVHLYIENDHFIKTGSGQTQGKLRKEDTTVYDAGTTAMPDEDEAAGTNYYSRYLNATKHGALSAMTFHQYTYCDRGSDIPGLDTVIDLDCLARMKLAGAGTNAVSGTIVRLKTIICQDRLGTNTRNIFSVCRHVAEGGYECLFSQPRALGWRIVQRVDRWPAESE
jgi:hypothetical protein